MDALLRADNVYKAYRKHKLAVPVLHGVDLDVHEGEFISVVGSSGSGKSTLLHLLGTLDKPDAGAIHFDGRRIDSLPNAERDRLRCEEFGYIFQFYHLLPELSTLENILVPAMVSSSMFGWMWRRKEMRRRAEQWLERVGLSHRKTHKPCELSGGEMQRAAVARALISKPRVLLADEPTGNLDSVNGQQVMGLLRELNRADDLTIVMVTHNMDLVQETDRVVRLADGRVDGEKISCSAFAEVEMGK